MTVSPILHFDLIQEKLDVLADATAFKVEREWPVNIRHLVFAQGFLALSMRMARHTYRTVFYLCADQRLGEHDWRWEYTLVLPAINRTIIDSIFNVIFMLEDIEPRSAWYHKSGWREMKLEYERTLKEYGADPAWNAWLTGTAKLLDEGTRQFGITAIEASNPKKGIPIWPNPGQMVNFGADPANLPPDRKFLGYLNDWHYRELSAQAHLSFFGMTRLGALVSRRDAPEEKREIIENKFYPQHRAVQVARTAILLLTLISELELYFSFGLSPRILEIWQVLAASVPEAQEIFKLRYADFWSTGIPQASTAP
jgi:hypothetical protein